MKVKGGQLLRVLISLAWFLASCAGGVAAAYAGGWIFNLLAAFCAFSAAVSGYIFKEEWKYL